MEKGYYLMLVNYIPSVSKSQSTIKMEKGYYKLVDGSDFILYDVAIHNKNGKGLLQCKNIPLQVTMTASQSTIKMEKGYYK